MRKVAELAQGAANDGLWDFDIESNEMTPGAVARPPRPNSASS